MKSKLLVGAMLFCACFCIQSAHAQLEVESTNNVKIGKTMSIATTRDPYALLNLSRTSDAQSSIWYGVKAHMKSRNSMPTGPIISLYGYSDASSVTSNYPINTVIGVFGRACMTQYTYSQFSAGVAGVANMYGGIGVYGAMINGSNTSYSFPTASLGSYAGYFAGSVKVTGTLTAPGLTTTSDSRLKENIQDLNNSVIGNLHLLRPVEYMLKPDSVQYVYLDGAKEMKVNHYGLVAQEVQELFPNLVYEDSNGYLSINYIELIPVLIKSIQELSTEVSDLKAHVNHLQTTKH